MKNIIGCIAALCLVSCQTLNPDGSTNASAANTNKLLTEAAKVLGQMAVSSLLGTAKSEIETKNDENMAHSAAQGVWSQATNWATGAAIEWAVNSWSNRKLPKTADAAKDTFNGVRGEPDEKANAIAAVISAAAATPQKQIGVSR